MASLTLLYGFLFLITISHTSILAKSDIYIIHMDLPAMPKIFSDHHSWYAATLSSISNVAKVSTTTTTTTSNLVYTYNNAIQGFCANLSPSEFEQLEKSLGFISSVRDVPVKAHTTHTSKFLGLNSNSGAWPDSSYGKDVIIGVVDSGIWPESESFKDDGMTQVPSRWKGKCVTDISFNSSMCNKKLIGARFYNKGLIANKPNTIISLNSSRDDDGHGTHTSSTAAGNYVEGASFFGYARGTARGMAPHAHVAMYKVLWNDDAYISDVLAAVDQAIEDGVDVLSISMGFREVPLYEDPIAIASFAAIKKGILVTSSAGNDGPQLWSLKNGAPWQLTVAAGTIDRELSGVVTLGNGVSAIGASLYHGNSTLSKVPVVYMKECSNDEELNKVGNKIVVCTGGEDYNIDDQIFYVKSANVAGGIFICLVSQLEDRIQTEFPAAFISPRDGQPILDYIKNNSDPRASLRFRKTYMGTKPAPLVARYSSRGPSSSCSTVLKPDLMAPGSLVLASWAQFSSADRFNIIYGTSMACPHVAGVGALLKGVHPEWSPAAIRSAMMTTSDSLDNTLNPIKDFGDGSQAASPLAMGAGHINPNKALDPGLIYDIDAEDYVGLLCSLKYTKNQIKTITRFSAFNCSNPSSNLNYPSFIAFFNASEFSSGTIVHKFQRTVTNVGDGMSTYVANLTSMDEIHSSIVPNKLVFRHKYEKLSYTLSLKGPKRLTEWVVYGFLSWVEVGGKHVVRSPIVATRVNQDDVDD